MIKLRAVWAWIVGCSWVVSAACADGPNERLRGLGVELPAPSAAIANYVPAVRTGNLVFLAGHLPRGADGKIVQGKVGAGVDEAAGYEAARLTAIALLGSLAAEIGNLDRVARIVRVGGYVNSAPDFTRHPQVINGCSDLLVAVFGESGRHARVAAGMSSLPLDAVVEIEMVVEVRD
jgi:enamine deaminase RidA (YjgF/YER057c/UK114 family)